MNKYVSLDEKSASNCQLLERRLDWYVQEVNYDDDTIMWVTPKWQQVTNPSIAFGVQPSRAWVSPTPDCPLTHWQGWEASHERGSNSWRNHEQANFSWRKWWRENNFFPLSSHLSSSSPKGLNWWYGQRCISTLTPLHPSWKENLKTKREIIKFLKMQVSKHKNGLCVTSQG